MKTGIGIHGRRTLAILGFLTLIFIMYLALFVSLPIAAISLVSTLMFIVPFAPGIIELYRRRDDKPLYINMDYVKDPFYFGRSFKSILKKAVDDSGIRTGSVDLNLSKPETVNIYDESTAKGKINPEQIGYFLNDFTAADDSDFQKELYIIGQAELGANSRFRALYCEGDLKLSENAQIIRWIYSEGKIKAGKKCYLGRSAASENMIELDSQCRFHSLYGTPVATGPFSQKNSSYPGYQAADEVQSWRIINKHLFVGLASGQTEDSDLSPYLQMERKRIIVSFEGEVRLNLVARKELLIKAPVVLIGHIKGYHDIIVEDNVVVHGNIFSEGKIIIGDNCTILGNLFSQESVEIGDHSRVGSPDKVKSVIGKKGLRLGKSVILYSYLLTEGEGVTK